MASGGRCSGQGHSPVGAAGSVPITGGEEGLVHSLHERLRLGAPGSPGGTHPAAMRRGHGRSVHSLQPRAQTLPALEPREPRIWGGGFPASPQERPSARARRKSHASSQSRGCPEGSWLPTPSTAAAGGPSPHALTHPGRKMCSVPPTAGTRKHRRSSSLELNMARVCRWGGLLLRGACGTRRTP